VTPKKGGGEFQFPRGKSSDQRDVGRGRPQRQGLKPWRKTGGGGGDGGGRGAGAPSRGGKPASGGGSPTAVNDPLQVGALAEKWTAVTQ